ncbi:hypothetical protein ACJQWK_07732 [Exserohilum turcicum]
MVDSFEHDPLQALQSTLLDSFPPRMVKIWSLPKEEFPVTTKLGQRFQEEVKKRKHIHAEMMLMAYLVGCRGLSSEVFPYLGVSKKTCLLCGHMLREVNFFETRGNHGKCYSQWTFPHTLQTNPEAAEKLQSAIQRLRDILRGEVIERDVPYRDAEKESAMAVPISPTYERTVTLFNSVIEDPRLLSRESEWLSMPQKRAREANNGNRSVEPFHEQDSDSTSECDIEKAETTSPKFCAFCAAHCSIDCYRSDWHQHKFSCRLGRPVDATDDLVLACHTNKFPSDDDVLHKYGFMSFTSGYDRCRLFNLYRRLVVHWEIDEDELRSAVNNNKLKEMLICRCSQTKDPDLQWLKNVESFEAKAKEGELSTLIEAAKRKLLSPDENKVPITELQPLEKQRALVFYAQIQNGFMIDVDEDNWISLGFCTRTNCNSEQQLAWAYKLLIARCSLDEFWTAMAESKMAELFSKYTLTGQISQMRNFKDLKDIVKKRHQSVWELKRFTRMNAADPHRAVVNDYGFMNCEDARQRMQLRDIYQKYFERGENEMKLHEACISGTLGSFLESVLGNLRVGRDLFRNPYPLQNSTLMGMVTDVVLVCTQSMLDQVKAFKEDGQELFVIPDTMEDEMMRHVHERAAFLGTGVRKRYRSGLHGKICEELSF